MKYFFLISALLSASHGFAMEGNEDAERAKCEARFVLGSRVSDPSNRMGSEYFVQSCCAARRFIGKQDPYRYMYKLEIVQKGIVYNSQKTLHEIPLAEALYELDKVCDCKNK